MVNKNERFKSVFIQFLICAKRLDFNKKGKPAHHLILWGGALPRGGGAGLSTGFERTRASRRGVLHRGGTVERQDREEAHGAGSAARFGQPPRLVRSVRRVGGIHRRGGQGILTKHKVNSLEVIAIYLLERLLEIRVIDC